MSFPRTLRAHRGGGRVPRGGGGGAQCHGSPACFCRVRGGCLGRDTTPPPPRRAARISIPCTGAGKEMTHALVD